MHGPARSSWRRGALAAVGLATVGGAVLAVPTSATAHPGAPATIAISIAASTGNTPVGGLHYTSYGRRAVVHGVVSGATNPATVRLYATPFHRARRAVAVTHTTANGSYRFNVRQSLATTYQARSGAATSASLTVYAVVYGYFEGAAGCRGAGPPPSCSYTTVFGFRAPPADARREADKHIYLYLGVRRQPGREPPPPRAGTLDPSRRVIRTFLGRGRYRITLRFAINRGDNEGWHARYEFCWRDTERADGLGLPGRHGCGNRRVRFGPYLG